MTRRAFVAVAAAGTLWLAMAPAAGAVTFHYNAYGGFVPGSESGTPPFFNPDYDNENDWYKEPGPNNNSPAPDANHFMDYSWGDSTPGNNIGDDLRSGFRLLDTGAVPGGPSTDGEHISGQVTVNGGLVNAGYVTHYNQPNPWEGTGTVEVHWHIDLFDGTPVPGDFSNLVSPIVESTFLLEILETANNAGQCDPNQTAGSVCDDRLQVIAVSPDGTNFTPVDTFTDLGPVWIDRLDDAGYLADLVYDPQLNGWPDLSSYRIVIVVYHVLDIIYSNRYDTAIHARDVYWCGIRDIEYVNSLVGPVLWLSENDT